MSNDVTTSDGGAPMTPSTSRRRRLWVATSVAGLTGVVSLATLGGLAARHDRPGDPQRASENHAAALKAASDAGKAADTQPGKEAGTSGDAEEQNQFDQYGWDGKERSENRGEKRDDRGGRDAQDEYGEPAREVPCDPEKLVEAVVLANNTEGGTLKLAPHCTYQLSRFDASANALPLITSPIVIKGEKSTITRAGGVAPFRFFEVDGGGHLILSDLTLKGGQAVPTATSPGNGGAVRVRAGGFVRLAETRLVDNAATGAAPNGNGGAIDNLGTTQLSHTIVSGNSATGNGGGIANTGVLDIKESSVDHNKADGQGGGIFNNGGTVRISHANIDHNKAGLAGGGLASLGGAVTVEHSKITGNVSCAPIPTALTSTGGGGIFSAGTTQLILRHVVVADNTATADGAGIWNGGTATIEHSRILANTAGTIPGNPGWGGGILNQGTMTLIESEIARNKAGLGGGIRNFAGTINLVKTKITQNTATVAGGGIDNAGIVTVDDKSVITDNQPKNCAGIPVPGCFDDGPASPNRATATTRR